MFIKQRHQYVCLIWRKTWIYVDDFAESSDEFWWKNRAEGYISLSWPYCFVDKSLVSVADVEVNIMFWFWLCFKHKQINY
jgi:hypothetical protein